MTDLVITAASVTADPSASVQSGRAGEAVTAGKAVYLSSTTKKWMLADSNSGTAEARKAGGIALNGAALNQPLAVCTAGDVTIGAAVTAGTDYYLSDAPGGICPRADVGSGEAVCLIGFAKSATVLNVAINYPGVTL